MSFATWSTLQYYCSGIAPDDCPGQFRPIAMSGLTSTAWDGDPFRRKSTARPVVRHRQITLTHSHITRGWQTGDQLGKNRRNWIQVCAYSVLQGFILLYRRTVLHLRVDFINHKIIGARNYQKTQELSENQAHTKYEAPYCDYLIGDRW